MVTFLADPKPVPPLKVPPSSSIVTVRVIDSTTTLLLDSDLFWKPQIKGFNSVKAPVYCFLVSNGHRHIIFDLGVRRDWENYAPSTVSIIKSTTEVETDKNVSEILDSDVTGLGVRSRDIGAIIWSHNHFDHVGDPSTFPPSTDLLVGPGFKDHYWPGYPTNSKSGLLDSDAKGRNFREIDFKKDGDCLKIGRFDAVDFFGDGSFYILDAPGHAVGHICGFARVTSAPDSFVFMGADACHHVGLFRPTQYMPLPATISPSPLEKFGAGSCLGAIFQQFHPRESSSEPFLRPSEFAFPNYSLAQETLWKIEELDAADNVLVIIAHDHTLRDVIDFYPKTVNDWHSKGVNSKKRWLFLKDFEDVMK